MNTYNQMHNYNTLHKYILLTHFHMLNESLSQFYDISSAAMLWTLILYYVNVNILTPILHHNHYRHPFVCQDPKRDTFSREKATLIIKVKNECMMSVREMRRWREQ